MSKLEPGAMAPEFSLRDVDGKTYSFDPVTTPLALAIFFKTSCPTCHYAWKYYQRLHEAYQGAGLHVLGISQHDVDGTRNYRAEHGATFPHLLDDGFAVSREYDPSFVPTGFLVDAGGTIVETFESWNSQGLNDFSGRVAERLGVASRQIVLPGDNALSTKIG